MAAATVSLGATKGPTRKSWRRRWFAARPADAHRSSRPDRGLPAGPLGAFFDLDGTLVSGFTATAHAGDRFRRGQSSIGEVLGVIEASVRYRLGRMQFERLLDRAAGYLRGESLAELDEVGERIYSERVAKRVYPMMRAVVAAHQAHGHSVVMSTSALTIHAEPVARALGISHVVCNNFELDDNGLLHRPDRPADRVGRAESRCGPTVLRRERCRVGAELLTPTGNEDAALMTLVGHPRPVNPRSGLVAMAAAHGWPVLRVGG